MSGTEEFDRRSQDMRSRASEGKQLARPIVSGDAFQLVDDALKFVYDAVASC